MTHNYLATIAQAIREEVPGSAMPEGNVDLLFLFYALLALTCGEGTNEKDVHDAWTAWMTAAGEEHRSMVPFEQLPGSVTKEDEPYVRAIQTVAKRLATSES